MIGSLNILKMKPLEITCDHCNGRGRFSDHEEAGGSIECRECNGSGFKPTQLGVQILELIRHNSRVEINAELRVSSAR
jgi:DnaJ-class molecular chaperone